MLSLSNLSLHISDNQRLDMLIDWLQTRPRYITYGTSGDLVTLLEELRAFRKKAAE